VFVLICGRGRQGFRIQQVFGPIAAQNLRSIALSGLVRQQEPGGGEGLSALKHHVTLFDRWLYIISILCFS
jgi:hypothetical protein